MSRLLVANIISFVGALFLCLSCIAKTKRRVATYQFIQCGLLVFAQLAFGKGSGAVSMGAAFVRNVCIATGHYGIIPMILIASFTLIFGLRFNTYGFIGLMPVAVGIFYTVALYFSKGIKGTKIALSVLLLVWVIYSLLILDFFGVVSNALALTLNLLTLKNMTKEKIKRPLQ